MLRTMLLPCQRWDLAQAVVPGVHEQQTTAADTHGRYDRRITAVEAHEPQMIVAEAQGPLTTVIEVAEQPEPLLLLTLELLSRHPEDQAFLLFDERRRKIETNLLWRA